MSRGSSSQTRPKTRHLLAESRALLEFGASALLMPVLMSAPRGDGHPVMVLPGFMASDGSTAPLRRYLKAKGYTVQGWGLGRNLGRHVNVDDQVISDQLINQVISFSLEHEQKVSLIGWSLGGILCREVARVIPECIRQVITLGSPFNGSKESAPVASRLFNAINGDIAVARPEIPARMIKPLPVPCTAIFSRSDGIAHWQACKHEADHPHREMENIEVRGSHIGLGHNPQVVWILADRLAQPEGQWQPFRQKTMARLLFPNPERGGGN